MKYGPQHIIKRRAQIKTSGGGDFNVRIKKYNSDNSVLKCKEGGKTTYIDFDKIVSIKPKSLFLEILWVVLFIGIFLSGLYYMSKQSKYTYEKNPTQNRRYDE